MMMLRRQLTQIGTMNKEEGIMSIINKLTGLFTREDVEEAIRFSKSEVKRLREELFILRLLLSKAHMRDPKTGRLLKKGVMPKREKARK
jgi:hypothetical protein